MELADARSLSPETQQPLRQRAVAAVVEQGRAQQQVARELGVARATVNRWVQRYRARGEPALAARKQGRPPHPRLERTQVAQLTQLIRNYAPEQLPYYYSRGLHLELPAVRCCICWHVEITKLQQLCVAKMDSRFPIRDCSTTRCGEAVAALIRQQCGQQLSRQAVSNYLHAWGLSPQKPAKRAREQYPKAVRGWMEYQYPALQRRAQLEGAQIHWGDEMGLRSDHQTGTRWAPKGQTPVVSITGQRFGCNVISSLANLCTSIVHCFTYFLKLAQVSRLAL